MNREDVIRIAQEAGFDKWDSTCLSGKSDLDEKLAVGEYAIGEAVFKFATLVAAVEREACAKVCDDLPVPPYVSDNDAHIWDLTCVDCAEAIRERGAP
jgi:hypothetical protein